MNLAMRIQQLRKKAGLTQQELADKLSISRSTLAGYETESKQPSYDVLVQIAHYFNVSTDYLLCAGLFSEETYSLVVMYRDVILKKVFEAGLITKSVYHELHYCDMDKCIIFLSTIISSITGDKNEIRFSYSYNLGSICKQMFETLTAEQKENFRYTGVSDIELSNHQTELINKMNELPYEQQNKIADYINMSYEIEKASSSVAADRVAEDPGIYNPTTKQGKLYPSNGTEG